MSWHGKGGEEDVLKDDACILPFHSVFSCSLVKDESEPISPSGVQYHYGALEKWYRWVLRLPPRRRR